MQASQSVGIGAASRLTTRAFRLNWYAVDALDATFEETRVCEQHLYLRRHAAAVCVLPPLRRFAKERSIELIFTENAVPWERVFFSGRQRAKFQIGVANRGAAANTR